MDNETAIFVVDNNNAFARAADKAGTGDAYQGFQLVALESFTKSDVLKACEIALRT